MLNFLSSDKDYQQCPEAMDFVRKYLQEATPLPTDAQVMRFACDQITLSQGIIAELGVCTGRTINFIAALNPQHTVYGFDSFEGLPDDWRGRVDAGDWEGAFGFHSAQGIPPVLHNVTLVKGLFSETLPVFSQEILKDLPIAFLHIDCDLYQSTKEVFSTIGHRLIPGSIVIFDELYNYPGWEVHEWKALQEFLAESGKTVEYIAYNANFEQVVVRFC